MSGLPYFDLLLDGRRTGDPAAAVFERWVHWGYWERPPEGEVSAEQYRAAMARLDEEIVAGARLSDGMAVADVGCGFGGTLARLSERYPSSPLVGVNFDARQLALAQPSRARFLRADACALPLRSGAFDAVLAVECIFHFPSRLGFLKEAARALKPGGRLTLSDFVPARESISGGFVGRWLEKKIAAGYGSLGSGWKDGGYAAMAKQAGLVVESDRDVTVETLPTYPFLIKMIREKGFGGPESRMLFPTRIIHWLSLARIVRYRIVSFSKPA